MAKLRRGCGYKPSEVAPPLRYLLRLADRSGIHPDRLTGDKPGAVWTLEDLTICEKYHAALKQVCPGCGQPVEDHLDGQEHDIYLIECDRQKAVAKAQFEWDKIHKSEIKSFHEGKSPDPHAGIYWMANIKQ